MASFTLGCYLSIASWTKIYVSHMTICWNKLIFYCVLNTKAQLYPEKNEILPHKDKKMYVIFKKSLALDHFKASVGSMANY